jgi:hypothetical protein
VHAMGPRIDPPICTAFGSELIKNGCRSDPGHLRDSTQRMEAGGGSLRAIAHAERSHGKGDKPCGNLISSSGSLR